jgi:hypothetical protein
VLAAAGSFRSFAAYLFWLLGTCCLDKRCVLRVRPAPSLTSSWRVVAKPPVLCLLVDLVGGWRPVSSLRFPWHLSWWVVGQVMHKTTCVSHGRSGVPLGGSFELLACLLNACGVVFDPPDQSGDFHIRENRSLILCRTPAHALSLSYGTKAAARYRGPRSCKTAAAATSRGAPARGAPPGDCRSKFEICRHEHALKTRLAASCCCCRPTHSSCRPRPDRLDFEQQKVNLIDKLYILSA